MCLYTAGHLRGSEIKGICPTVIVFADGGRVPKTPHHDTSSVHVHTFTHVYTMSIGPLQSMLDPLPLLHSPLLLALDEATTAAL